MGTKAPSPVNARAGLRLKHLREARRMTQRDVERETEARFGREGMVFSQRISLLEKGEIDKPYIVDLVHVGEVLGLRPPEVLALYGLYTPPDEERLDPDIQEAVDLSKRLDGDLKRQFLSWVQFANLQAIARLREGQRERRDEV